MQPLRYEYGYRERYRFTGSLAPTLKPNMAIQIRVKKKLINAKTTGCTTKNGFVNATANGKNYFCEWFLGEWHGSQR